MGRADTAPGPGERQPRETAPAFEAFRTYLDLGPQRSLSKVGQALGKSKTLMDRWSSRWDWSERVRLIESSAASHVDDERSAVLAQAARRQAQEARLHASATALVAQALVRKVTADPQVLEKMSIEDLARLEASMARSHNRAIVTERLALGMTTEQQGERLPREQAAEMAARLSDDELDARLAGVDDLTVQREKRRRRREEATS